jgi:glucokinase
MILAGDIGGTNSRLAFFQEQGGELRLVLHHDFPSRQAKGLEQIVATFISQQGRAVECAGFGVAGPVRNGRCTATNLPWVIEAAALAREMGLPSVALVNDLEAYAYGALELPAADFLVLNPGAPQASGNAAVVSAGTGLGQAGLYWDGERYHPFACEGGHADFAPNGELQVELYRYLAGKFGHVSRERVLSGPGLKNVYDFLRDSGRWPQPSWLSDELRAAADPSAAIARAAQEGKAPICEQALELWTAVYGAEAGNFALSILATGGVYLGGGIAPKLRSTLQQPTFMQAFVAKGRMQPLLEAVPVRIILNEKAGLIGAARCAVLQAGAGRTVPA